MIHYFLYTNFTILTIFSGVSDLAANFHVMWLFLDSVNYICTYGINTKVPENDVILMSVMLNGLFQYVGGCV